MTLANTGTVICFGTANPEDEKLILPQFQPYVEKGEIASLPSYRFYMRLGALNPEEPFSSTTTLTTIDKNPNRAEKVIAHSRKKYAINPVEKKQENYRGSYAVKKKYKAKRKSSSILP